MTPKPDGPTEIVIATEDLLVWIDDVLRDAVAWQRDLEAKRQGHGASDDSERSQAIRLCEALRGLHDGIQGALRDYKQRPLDDALRTFEKRA